VDVLQNDVRRDKKRGKGGETKQGPKYWCVKKSERKGNHCEDKLDSDETRMSMVKMKTEMMKRRRIVYMRGQEFGDQG
jgi:hypothetical protein